MREPRTGLDQNPLQSFHFTTEERASGATRGSVNDTRVLRAQGGSGLYHQLSLLSAWGPSPVPHHLQFLKQSYKYAREENRHKIVEFMILK